MKWETRFSRLNLIVGLIFPAGKRANYERKSCFMYYKFTIFFFFIFLQLSTNISNSYKLYSILRHQLLCSPIWLPETNKSDRNRTGDSMSVLEFYSTNMSIICIFFIQIIQYGTAKFTFILFLSCRDLWA